MKEQYQAKTGGVQHLNHRDFSVLNKPGSDFWRLTLGEPSLYYDSCPLRATVPHFAEHKPHRPRALALAVTRHCTRSRPTPRYTNDQSYTLRRLATARTYAINATLTILKTQRLLSRPLCEALHVTPDFVTRQQVARAMGSYTPTTRPP